MKNLMSKAHKMTKTIVAKYKDVDYKAQLGLCMSYLLKIKEVFMTVLKGTEKQVAWAEKIKENLLESINEKTVPQIFFVFTKSEKGEKFISELKTTKEDNQNYFSNNNLSNQYVISKIKKLIEDEQNAKTFIENQTLISFFKTILK